MNILHGQPTRCSLSTVSPTNYAEINCFDRLGLSGAARQALQGVQPGTAAYLTRAKLGGVRHAEMFFDPETHMQRGVDIGTVITGIASGCAGSEQRYGITTQLIMCFLRDRTGAEALATLRSAKPYIPYLSGVGLDSAERGIRLPGLSTCSAWPGRISVCMPWPMPGKRARVNTYGKRSTFWAQSASTMACAASRTRNSSLIW